MIPLVVYVILFALVSARGQPEFARKLPGMGRFYPTTIEIWEKRAKGMKLKITYGRIVSQFGKWHILETQHYGNLMVPPMETILTNERGKDVMIFVSTEKDEYHPIVGIEEIHPYEEFELPEKDSDGNVVKVPKKDKDGNIILRPDGTPELEVLMKKVKRFIYKPVTQNQRMFWRAEYEESKDKYSKSLTFWDKILPYVGLILLGAFIIMGAALVLQNMGGISDNMVEIAKQYAANPNTPNMPINTTTW
jgi:hypothetical protein